MATPLLAPASADAVQRRCSRSLQLEDALRASLEARTGPAGMAQDFQAYDELANVMMVGALEMDLVGATHPDHAVRDAARACAGKLAEKAAGVSLSRPIYDRLAAIPTAGLAPAAAYALQKILRNYRLAGVDKDAATRTRVAVLKKQIAEAGLAFQRNLAEDKSEITLASVDDLAGMPQDYIDAHKPSADGLIHIRTVALDANPLIEFADHEAVRKQMYLRFANRAWPANEATLETLLARRAELARLLGYPSFAALDTADKMVGTPQHVKAFLDSIAAAAIAGSERDNAVLLAEQKRLMPGETTLQPWNTSYLTDIVTRREYGLDETQVRQYFSYTKTRDGVFALVHDLFGADIRPWKGAHFWSSDVEGYELYDHGKLVGRFFLDMHSRAGKFQHAKTAAVRMGLSSGQIPLAGLVCNLAATGPIDHAGVRTFLHEFGHLLHVLYSGHQQYVSQSMMTLQWDFIEAPSQLLEEWIWDADTLRRFATNAKGEPIPVALVARMNAARHFGEASFWRRQLGLANVSLGFHDRPAGFALAPMWLQLYDPYGPVPTPEGAHAYAAFGALEDYGSFYYTYVWSKAIALDLFTRFRAEGMRSPQVALAYRKAVLDPGGSQPADALIEHFLGRPMSTAAFRQMLQK
ncbi:M3 family metallopeptidase [Dyella sp.]|uniref:M3 family metallopeptidase n=1 Tax=Dyella sp. TaxID=1869338 RepID=UPI002D7A29D4|nr:M3 family metallopeptidase [Dyella sp.]HET6433677.1 M3 family metallopeptidase [Dyella sp.]